MKKKYITAIIGFGKLGILYTCLSNIHESTNLKYIVEPNFILRIFLKKRLKNVNILKDIKDLKNKALDLVFVTTPNFTHFEISKFLIKNTDANLFIEKPLAISLNEIKKLNELSKFKKKKIQVGYMLRYCKTYILTKDIIDKKKFGKVVKFSCSMFSSQVFAETNNWRFRKERAGGGVLITQNSHLIDLIQWFFGLPKNIYANTRKIFSKNVEDEVSANFEYENFSGTLETSWSKKGYRNLTTNIEIFFENGSIKVNEDQLEIKPNFNEESNNQINKVSTFSPNFFDLAGDYYSAQFSDFIDLENKHNKINNIDDSLKIHHIIESIYASSEKKKKIEIDENFS